MELFNKRYFCFISFAFILTSFFLTFYGSVVKICVAVIAAVACIVSLTVLIKTKKYKFAALFALFVCLSVSVSSFNSYFFISKAKTEAEALIGKNTVLVKIVSQNAEDEYNVRLLRVGDRNVDIKSELNLKTEQ